MVHTRPKKLTFEEYLAYEDDTDNRYELIEGELVPLPPESGLNSSIANYLFFALVSAGVPLPLVHSHSCEIQVPILQSGDAANRYPDLIVLREEHWDLTQTRLTITLDMPPPRLVVEVVSPGQVNRERDYVRKRAQYAARFIPEYWILGTDVCADAATDGCAATEIINPTGQIVMVLSLEVESVGTFHETSLQYVEAVFRGSDVVPRALRDRIISPTFPDLELATAQIFSGARL